MSRVAVILPAAGLGTRMGRNNGSGVSAVAASGGISRKQFMLLEGSPILAHTVHKFLQSAMIDEIVVAVRADDVGWVTELLDKLLTDLPERLPAAAARTIVVRAVAGGDTRQKSVENAFYSLSPETELVAVHDAVRPFVEVETIERAIEEARAHGGAIVGIVPVDTVKQVSGAQASGAKVRTTISRERLVLAQTPQVFRYHVLEQAIAMARRDGFTGTDESSLVERLETIEVSVVLGSERNIKITRPGDMGLARLFLEQDARRLKSQETTSRETTGRETTGS